MKCNTQYRSRKPRHVPQRLIFAHVLTDDDNYVNVEHHFPFLRRLPTYSTSPWYFFICVYSILKWLLTRHSPGQLDSAAQNIFRDATPIKSLLGAQENYHTHQKREIVRKIKNELRNRNNNRVQLFRDSKRPSSFLRLLRPRAKPASWRSRSISTSRFQA